METGLHYNRYRYYDPTLGRYITSDPIGLSGGLNTYNYANSNSLSFIDPRGTNTVAACWVTAVFEPSPIGEVVCGCVSLGLLIARGVRIISIQENACGGDDGGSCPDTADDSEPTSEPVPAAEPPPPSGPGGDGDNRKNKRDRKKGKGASEQFEEIEAEQRRRRGAGDNTSIESIEKSKQRDKNFLRDLKNIDPNDIDDLF